ncbi:MAG: hypothetical protein QF855_03430, partial [Candidatus Pacebacteria bacterium]|nr:hypothetical protein [Candidatus Paceibacterota bacterium]MDP7367613.1 hypothetical protein [Candidatus Paceibacterota bacterium]MDP7648522.1 hypothetical protein [Candidatus Paceibacterota bacterium]
GSNFSKFGINSCYIAIIIILLIISPKSFFLEVISTYKYYKEEVIKMPRIMSRYVAERFSEKSKNI